MKIFTLAFILLASVPVLAQDAKVIPLDPDDATKVASLYAQKADLEKKIDDFYKGVTKKYTETMATRCIGWNDKNKCAATEKYITTLDGWGWGFKYSTDFKFIVPKPYPAGTVYNVNQLDQYDGGSLRWINPVNISPLKAN